MLPIYNGSKNKKLVIKKNFFCETSTIPDTYLNNEEVIFCNDEFYLQTCQADLVRDNGHKYFLSVLQDTTVPVSILFLSTPFSHSSVPKLRPVKVSFFFDRASDFSDIQGKVPRGAVGRTKT